MTVIYFIWFSLCGGMLVDGESSSEERWVPSEASSKEEDWLVAAPVPVPVPVLASTGADEDSEEDWLGAEELPIVGYVGASSQPVACPVPAVQVKRKGMPELAAFMDHPPGRGVNRRT